MTEQGWEGGSGDARVDGSFCTELLEQQTASPGSGRTGVGALQGPGLPARKEPTLLLVPLWSRVLCQRSAELAAVAVRLMVLLRNAVLSKSKRSPGMSGF